MQLEGQGAAGAPASSTDITAVETSAAHAAADRRERPVRWVQAFAILALAYATYWIGWRWTHTINTDPKAFVPSMILLLAETWAYINMCLFVMLTWRLTDREPGPAPDGRTVDVFITVYDEPLEIVRRTAVGAREIRYPHRTYILDDGKRDELLAMTRELGIGYIRRVGNAHAKSGNLNYAISVTRGEFILQLDADHVPMPSILDRLLGYFNDPRMALVQSPQDFYNVDSFTHVRNDEGRRLWEENRIFYSLIQPGRDHWNASFFCGSCGVIRRSALEEIGGFASQTIIEDMETTMQLHAHGYKSAYHRETLAYGLAPGAAGAYHVQRLRWGQGAMQILRKLKPLTMRGLTLQQRLAYFAGTACYFEGWQKCVFYLMPLFYFFTGILPVGGDQHAFLIRLIPYILISIAAFELLSRGTGYLFLSERFTMVRVWTYMMAALAVFTRKPLKFNVTPKGHAAVPRMAYMPQLTLLLLSVAAPVWATVAYRAHWIDYTAHGWGSWAFWMNGVWALWNCCFAYYVVRHSLTMRQRRDDHRFEEQMVIDVQIAGEGETILVPAMTFDLNSAGLGFRATQPVPVGTKVSIALPLGEKTIPTTGEVRHVAPVRSHLGAVYSHGVDFTALPIEARDTIELFCTNHSMAVWRMRYRQSIDIVQLAGERIRNLRAGRRRLVGLPAMVRAHAAEPDGGAALTHSLVLEELGERGARLIGNMAFAPGTQVTFEVPGSTIHGTGVVRHVQTHRTSMAVLFSLGVEFSDGTRRPSRWLPASITSLLPGGGESHEPTARAS